MSEFNRLFLAAEKFLIALLYQPYGPDTWRRAYRRAMLGHYRRRWRWWPEREEELRRVLREERPDLLKGRRKFSENHLPVAETAAQPQLSAQAPTGALPARRQFSENHLIADCRLSASLLGANMGDWFQYSLYEKPWRIRWRAVPEERLQFLIRYMNDQSMNYVLGSKAGFAERWSGFFDRKWCGINIPGETDRDGFISCFRGLPKIIVKPDDAGWGKDVHTEDMSDPGAVYDRLKNTGKPLIAEEYVEQKGFFHVLNPSSVNTVRVTTVRLSLAHDPQPVYTQLRVGKPGSVTDNFSGGGISFTADRGTGLLSEGIDNRGRHYELLPGHGIPARTVRLPAYEECVKFAVDAHRVAPEGNVVIGWDICVTEDEHAAPESRYRLLMIEGNEIPGFTAPPANGEDLWKVMKGWITEYDRLKKNREKEQASQ